MRRRRYEVEEEEGPETKTEEGRVNLLSDLPGQGRRQRVEAWDLLKIAMPLRKYLCQMKRGWPIR